MKKKKVVAITVITTCLMVGNATVKAEETQSETKQSLSEILQESNTNENASTQRETIPSEMTKLELWTFADSYADFYKEIVHKWNDINPDRQIDLTITTYSYTDLHENLLENLQKGNGAPDICDVEVGQFPNVVEGENDWLYPLDNAIQSYLPEIETTGIETYMGADQHYYGTPLFLGATVMYYNMAELERYGITQADVEKIITWDDYQSLGSRYLQTRNESGKYWTSVDSGGTDWMWIAMSESGEDWNRGTNGEINVELDSVKRMLNMQSQWLSEDIAEVSPGGQIDVESGYTNIKEHNIVSFPKAIWFMSRFLYYMPEEKGNWYIGKCPVFEEGQYYPVTPGGNGAVVTQQSVNKELAADFVCFATLSLDGASEIWKEFGFDACNVFAWADDDLIGEQGNLYNTFFRNNPYDVLDTVFQEFGKVSVTKSSPVINRQFIQSTLQEILENGASIERALENAQQQIVSAEY